MAIRRHNRTVAAVLASLGFLILVVGVTYFGMLVLAVRFSEVPEERFTATAELGQFLGTRDPDWAWYKDGRVYGGASLLLALISILFGVHKLARITIVPDSSIKNVVLAIPSWVDSRWIASSFKPSLRINSTMVPSGTAWLL